MQAALNQISPDETSANEAAIVDLCSFLSRPARYLMPEMISYHLNACGLADATTEDAPSANWVDRLIYQRFLQHLDMRSARDHIDVWQDTPGQTRAREIALAPQSILDRFSILSASAQLRPFLISSVLKRELARQREIIGDDGWEIAFGGAQFLYRGIDSFGTPEQAYEEIFQAQNTIAEARNALIEHGRRLLKAALATTHVFWAEVFAFRLITPQASLAADIAMPQNIAGSLFKLWDRQCHDFLNT